MNSKISKETILKLEDTGKTEELKGIVQEDDSVNHPSHYTSGKIECIDYIVDKGLGFHLGNAVKYITRAGKKSEQGMTNKEKTIEDLEKAVWYINHYIKVLKEGNDGNC